ncbi:MAG TPA: NAD(P)-dependent alcohol dehydrogenase [Candidatus Binataceae bacterium]|jgi:NADPH:quinone reductase-like Zn-dependent oxidoreductase|nr:NAD(P)-dependent alcohol dehydrogenase [Candidatus Binataceae bacterium]
MNAYEIKNEGGTGRLALVDRPKPVPGPGEVLIRVRATSLNYRDLLTVRGRMGGATKPGLIPLSDGAGEVAEVGAGVSRVRVGDRVAAIFNPAWISGRARSGMADSSLGGGTTDGMLREYALLHESAVVHMPEHLSFEEAATLPCAGVTAWNALVPTGRVAAGDTVVVQGTGGVSIFGLQFARLCGARVIATTGSEGKMARLRELGADEVINYKTTPQWDQRVMELTSGEGANHILDVGGAGTLAPALQAIAAGGFITVIGLLTGVGGEINPLGILFRAAHVVGIRVGSREMFEDMNRAISVNRMRPVIDRVFQFEEAAGALDHLASGKHFGKVCIRV